ncbi:MAG TPA: hypothetical protein VNF27_12830 [Candidatus Binataceae bacterium]|nr:hypothetical protein [Candidatus Binataceae bacterium]
MAELFSLMLEFTPCKNVCMAAKPSSSCLFIRRALLCQRRRMARLLGDVLAFSRIVTAKNPQPENRIGATIVGRISSICAVFLKARI